MFLEDVVEVFDGDVSGEAAGELQEAGVEAYGDFHAGVVVGDDGREEWGLAEFADFHDFRQVFMFLGEAVLPRGFQGQGLFFFVLFDHLFAAAAIAGE